MPAATFCLAEFTGRGVRVAVVDSGIHAGHPHITNAVDDGVAIRDDGSLDADFADRLGHGTAVAAAIGEKAPDAVLLPVRVFWQTLSTRIAALVRGIDEAATRGADVINLSLGTTNRTHAAALRSAVDRAHAHGAVLVAALDDENVEWLPGSLDGVIPVRLDWTCPRDTYRVGRAGDRRVLMASGYPRGIPQVPREWNLKGISFAVANASGFVARAVEAAPRAAPSEIVALLEERQGDAIQRV
jgi:subtilisin family serine protease